MAGETCGESTGERTSLWWDGVFRKISGTPYATVEQRLATVPRKHETDGADPV